MAKHRQTLVLFPNWSASRDRFGWKLTHSYLSKDRAGNPREGHKDCYYPNLEQCARHIIDVEASHQETLENLLEWLEKAAEGISAGAHEVAITHEESKA